LRERKSFELAETVSKPWIWPDAAFPPRALRVIAPAMPSPYDNPAIYDRALATGRHRQITGGWWEETGRIQLDLLRGQGMQPSHRLLDVGAGALRLGCKAVPRVP
jgi:hypothetical protein